MRPLVFVVSMAVLGAAMVPAPSMARSKSLKKKASKLAGVVVHWFNLGTTGKLKRDLVVKALRRGMNGFRHCYRRALKRDGSLMGKFTLTLKISATGRVTYADALAGFGGDVNSCVKNHSWRLRFPTTGAEAEVKVGLNFKRMSRPPGPVPRWRKVGVPECDQYIRNHLTCLYRNVSATTRVETRKELKATYQAWRKTARTPEDRPELVKTCQVAAQKAQRAFDAYGCWIVK